MRPHRHRSDGRRRWPLPPAALAAALLAVGCGGGGGSDPPVADGGRPRSGGTLVVGASSDVRSVNQVLTAGTTFEQAILDQMFLRLFEEQPDYAEHPPTLAPQLAASQVWSEDRSELTIELRDDVFWSDGTPVSADDVRWTWQAQTSPDVAWPYASMKDSIVDVEVLGPRRLRVRFATASPSQLSDLNEGVILPRHAWSELPLADWRANNRWFQEHLVVNGPFTLESWEPQQQIVLRRNERYHVAGQPYLDRVVFRIVPQQANQIRQLLAGELDFVDHVGAAEAHKIQASPVTRLIAYWHRQYNYICWNVRRPLFAETAVRQALTMAIDRQALIDALSFGHARIATSPIISSVWAHDDRLEPWPYDPAAARRLLAEQGWRDGDGDGVLERNGRPFSFDLSTNADSTIRVDAAVLIQDQLRRVGVDAQVRRIEFTTLVDMNLEHDFDATLGGWGIDTSLDLTYAFHSDSYENGHNFGGYSNPELDGLIEATRREIDPAARLELLHRAQGIIHRDQPYTFLWEPQRLAAVNRRVRNAQPNPLSSYFHLQEWWLADG